MILYYFAKPNRLAFYNVINVLGELMLLRNSYSKKETILYQKHEVKAILNFLKKENKKVLEKSRTLKLT